VSLTTLLAETPERAYETEYTALVVDDEQVVLDERYDNPSARLTAIVELMLANHDEVAHQDVNDVLAPFGGANPDVALAAVMALYANWGVDVDVHLSEHQRDVGPAVLYTSLTDYGDGALYIEHFPSAADRLKELRQRAANVDVTRPAAFFDDADEETCKLAIEYALMPTRGRIYLLEAKREAAGEVYVGERS